MKNKKKIINIILAMLITLAVSFLFQVIEMDDKGGFIVNFLAKMVVSFRFDYFVDLLAFVGSYFLLDRFLIKEKPETLNVVLSVVFAFLFVVGQSYKNYESMFLFTANTFQLFVAIVVILGYAALFYLLIAMLMAAIEKANTSQGIEKPSKQFFWICFGTIAVCYTIWSLMNFPGTFNPDAQQQVDQVLGNIEWENVHPPFGSIIMGGLYKFGLSVGNATLGAYLYILLQNLVCALAFAYCTKKIYEWGAGIKTCIWVLLFFALNPFWLTYAQLYNKDQLYVGIMTVFTMQIADVIYQKEILVKDIIIISILALLAALLRKNGVYSIVPTLFLLIFAAKKGEKKKVIASLVAVLLIYEIVNKALYPMLGIKDGSIKEALSIPFQQTANYVKYYGDDVTLEEKEIIDEVLDYDSLAENYKPFLSSPVKDTYKEDSSKLPAYFGVWIKMFFKHPGSYMNAFMCNYSGYMAPVYSDLPGVDTEASKWDLKREMTHASGSGPLIVKQTKLLGENLPILKYLGDPGLYSWLLVLAIVLLIKKKKYKEIIFFVPNIMNLLVCFASPLNGSARYALPLIAMAPFYIFWTIRYYKNETKL